MDVRWHEELSSVFVLRAILACVYFFHALVVFVLKEKNVSLIQYMIKVLRNLQPLVLNVAYHRDELRSFFIAAAQIKIRDMLLLFRYLSCAAASHASRLQQSTKLLCRSHGKALTRTFQHCTTLFRPQIAPRSELAEQLLWMMKPKFPN